MFQIVFVRLPTWIIFFFSFFSFSLWTVFRVFIENCCNIASVLCLGYFFGCKTRGISGGSDIKNLLAVRETWVQSLAREEPLEEGVAAHSSILAWGIPWTEEPHGLPSMGSQRVRHNSATDPFTWDLNSPTRDRTHCPLHWRAKSSPLGHRGSPRTWIIFNIRYILVFWVAACHIMWMNEWVFSCLDRLSWICFPEVTAPLESMWHRKLWR